MTDESRSLLYQRLVERGMSVRKLAEESGIHRNTLNNLFNGAQVNLQAKSIEKIVLTLELPSNDVLKIFIPIVKLDKPGRYKTSI